jgi:hypothetical protein
MSIEDKCDICNEGKLTARSVPEQGISCMSCGIAMCDDCYDLSVRLYGFIGDKNLVLEKPSEPSTSFNDWPYNEYFPKDFGGFKMTRGCIECMTEIPPKRDKFGHFVKRENDVTGIIFEKKRKNKAIQNFI